MNKALFLLPILSLLANGLQAATNSISAEPPATTVSLYDDVLINATNVGAGTWTTKRATVATVLAAAPPPANITSNQLNAGTWQQATQQMVGYTLYSSSLGCAGNSDMVAGGGSDDYAKLQAALNLATTKPVHLIIEKPTLISTGLVFMGSTYLDFMPGAGLYLKNAGNSPPLSSSYDVARGTNGGQWLSISNIIISGGIINGNASGQQQSGFWLYAITGSWVHGIELHNVCTVIIQHCQLWNCGANQADASGIKGFTVLVNNIGSFWAQDNLIARPNYGGCDGFHFWGPVLNATVWQTRSVLWPLGSVQTPNSDDLIALNLNETYSYGQYYVLGCTMDNLSICDVWDQATANAVINFQTGGAGDSTGYHITNACIRNVSSVFNHITASVIPGGKVDNLEISGLKNTAVSLESIRIANLKIEVKCDATPPANASVDVYPDSTGANFVVRNNYPFLPTIRFSDINSNITISASGLFYCGPTNPIIGMAGYVYGQTNNPLVTIQALTGSGNSPIYGDVQQSSSASDGKPKATVSLNGINYRGGPYVQSFASPANLTGATPVAPTLGFNTNLFQNGLVWQINNGIPVAASLDPDFAGYASRAGVTNPPDVIALNSFVVGLKSDGIWTNLYCLYPLYGTNSTQTAQNLVSNVYNIAWSGLLLQSTNHSHAGVTNPDAASGWGDTGFVPAAVAGVTATNFHFMVWPSSTTGSGTLG